MVSRFTFLVFGFFITMGSIMLLHEMYISGFELSASLFIAGGLSICALVVGVFLIIRALYPTKSKEVNNRNDYV